MKTTAIFAAALALAGSSMAAAPPRPTIQTQIQTLEIQILNVINDIVQSNPALKADYSNGVNKFNTLTSEVEGPQPCSPFVPGRPATKKEAITALQTSQSGLMQLSLHLQNPDLKIVNGDFHADVCNALGYYSSVSQFVGA